MDKNHGKIHGSKHPSIPGRLDVSLSQSLGANGAQRAPGAHQGGAERRAACGSGRDAGGGGAAEAAGEEAPEHHGLGHGSR